MPCAPADIKSGKLLIKDQATDTGVRPFADGDNEPYYLSPSINLVGGVDQGTAKVGAANTIDVTVKNISTDAISDITIEVWVCDFTMGVSPASSLNSANPGGAPLIGFFAGPLQPNAEQVIPTESAWTPTGADAALNGGHVCIAANCFSDSDGAPLAAENNAFKFLCDSHHAQRNIHIAQVSPGMHRFHFNMRVANANPRLGAITHVQIQHVVGQRAFTDAIRGQLLATPGVVFGAVKPQVQVTGLRSQTINREMILAETKLAPAITATEHAVSVQHQLTHLTPAAVARVGIAATRKQFFLQVDQHNFVPLAFSSVLPKSFAIEAQGAGVGNLLQFNLKEHQTTTMAVDVELSPQARPGDMHAFDLTQHSPHGDVIGGARIVLIVK